MLLNHNSFFVLSTTMSIITQIEDFFFLTLTGVWFSLLALYPVLLYDFIPEQICDHVVE